MDFGPYVLSASEFCDIPNKAPEWLAAQETRHSITLKVNGRTYEVPFDPEVVAGIVFWTRDPMPMMRRLEQFREYKYWFIFSVTGDGPGMEPEISGKEEMIMATFRRLAEKIGPERVIWRYDPVVIPGKFDAEYHIEKFYEIARQLSGYTGKCVVEARRMPIWQMAEVAGWYGMRLNVGRAKIDYADIDRNKVGYIDVGRWVPGDAGTSKRVPGDANASRRVPGDAEVNMKVV